MGSYINASFPKAQRRSNGGEVEPPLEKSDYGHGPKYYAAEIESAGR